MDENRVISCEEALRRLEDFLDAELASLDQREVEKHLAVCEGCAEHFAFDRAALDQMQSKLREVDLPPQLRIRILALVSG